MKSWGKVGLECVAVARFDDWKQELESLSAALGVRTPLLLEKKSRWHRAWVLASLLTPTGVWGGGGCIVISSALLGESKATARYVLAHELGHVVRRHMERIGLPVAYIIGSGVLVYRFGHGLPASVVWALLFSWVIAMGLVMWTARGFVIEYEADEVAVRAVGLQAVRDGIRVMAKYEGGIL